MVVSGLTGEARSVLVSCGESPAGGDTAGKIGKADAEMGIVVFVEIGNVMHGFLATAQEPGWVSWAES